MPRFSLRSWLNAAAVSLRKPKSRRREQATNSFRFRPSLEILEDRTLPSTLTVLNAADSGAGSLRDTIAAAQSGDTIVFASNLNNQTIVLTSGELDIAKDLTIAGPGANKLAISGNDASRVLDVGSGAAVTLSGLTIEDGNADAGGGIDNASDLTLENCTIANNQTVNGMGGGGILNESGANLTLNHSQVADNTANAAAGTDVFGGGLLNEGNAVVTCSQIGGNQALGGSGSSFFAGSVGGGIDNYGGANLNATGSTFFNNKAIGAAGATGMGGALENNAGLSDDTASTATITDCLFTGNLASAGNGGYGNAGAIDNQGAGATMTITGSTVLNNKSVGGAYADGLTTLGQGEAGGILDFNGAILTLNNSVLLGNQAIGGDHSTPTAANPITGGGQGGGLEVALAQATVNNCSIIGNVARGGATDAGPGGSGFGGGIENIAGGSVSVNNSLIAGNVAIAGQGGGGSSTVLAGLGVGGGIDDSYTLTGFTPTSTMTITGSTIVGNLAIGSNGGAGGNGGDGLGGDGLGGGISVGFNAFIGFTDASQLTLTNTIVAGNDALGGKGGIGGNGGNGFGGGLIVFGGSSATAGGSTVAFNFAVGGLKGQGGGNGSGVGGGVYVSTGGAFTPDAATLVKKNHASTSNNDIYP